MNRIILMVVLLGGCVGEHHQVGAPVEPIEVQAQEDFAHPNADMCWSECLNKRLNAEKAAKEKARKAEEEAYYARMKRDREEAAKRPPVVAPPMPEKLYEQKPVVGFEVEPDGPSLRDR